MNLIVLDATDSSIVCTEFTDGKISEIDRYSIHPTGPATYPLMSTWDDLSEALTWWLAKRDTPSILGTSAFRKVLPLLNMDIQLKDLPEQVGAQLPD